MTKQTVSIVPKNLGNRRNQTCFHCHIQTSPGGNQKKNKRTAAKIMCKRKDTDITFAEHCSAGSAGNNSNCYGALVDEPGRRNSTVQCAENCE